MADSELQLFVWLRYCVGATQSCDYLFDCDILSKTHSRLRLFGFVAILYGGDIKFQLFVLCDNLSI